MITVREEIAKNLRFYRKKSNLTQKALAEKLNLKSSSVSNWETGINSVDIDTLHNICKIFEVSINDMFGSFANKNSEPLIDEKDITCLSANEKELINNYRSVNNKGQKRLLETSKELKDMDKYKKDTEFSGIQK